MVVKRGFTIIELIVVMGLAALLGGIVVSVIISSYQNNRKVESISIVQRDINLSIDRINRVLRSTTQIQSATETTLRIRGYLNASDENPSEIYFFIGVHNGNNALRYDVIPPTGTAPNFTYDPENAETFTLLPHVTNTVGDSLFTYFDDDAVQLSSPINLSAIKAVEVKPSALDSSGVLTTPITVSTRATLRNFKNNL